MTIQGAMNELVNLLNAEDIPIYYKGCIKKVIETIDDYINDEDDYVKRKTEQMEKKPRIRKRTGKPFRAVWLDNDHNEIGTPQTEREGE